MGLGCFVLRPPSAEEALRRFELAEQIGFDAAFATHVNGAEATVMLGAATARTSRIELGVGVIPIYTRTPATMAQAAATLWDLSGGRVTLGLGLGHRAVMKRWHGEEIERPAAEMREYLSIMRGILDGEPLPEAEKWASDMPLVELRAERVPLMIGALSPAMLRLAGEMAQGVVLWMCTPRYIAETVVPNVREGRRRAGLSMEGFDIVASIPTAVCEDAEPLRRDYVKQVANNLRLQFYRAMLERGGYREELAAIEEVDRYEGLFERIPGPALDALAGGRFVSDVAAIGSPDAVAAKLGDYAAAGVTVAGVNPVRIDDFEATLRATMAARGSIERTLGELGKIGPADREADRREERG